MSDLNDMVKKFHEVFGLPIHHSPLIPDQDRIELRLRLIREEFDELTGATYAHDLVEIADALGDLLYVIQGMALEFGIPLDLVLAEIHRSNMTKLWPDGKPHTRADGKILKPKDYSPANIAEVLEKVT